MEPWVQTIINAAVLITAVTVILAGIVALWKKVLRPGARLITSIDEMLPLLRELTNEFKNTPHAFAILDDIIAQFRTDSGSSLRDVVDRLEQAAITNREAVERAAVATQSTEQILAVALETVRQLAQQDREKIDRLIILLDRLTIKVDTTSATTSRLEQTGINVASELAASHSEPKRDAIPKKQLDRIETNTMDIKAHVEDKL